MSSHILVDPSICRHFTLFSRRTLFRLATTTTCISAQALRDHHENHSKAETDKSQLLLFFQFYITIWMRCLGDFDFTVNSGGFSHSTAADFMYLKSCTYVTSLNRSHHDNIWSNGAGKMSYTINSLGSILISSFLLAVFADAGPTSPSCSPLIIPYGRVYYHNEEKTASFTCIPGFRMMGSPTIRCREGFWDRLPPICFNTGTNKSCRFFAMHTLYHCNLWFFWRAGLSAYSDDS